MIAARPRVLAVLPGFIPSTMITVVKPLMNLHRAGRISARIVLESQAGRNDIDWAEAIVLCRNTEPRHAPLLAAIRTRGTPLIYDLDDNLFELPPNCDGSSREREASRQAMLEEYLRAAALVRVYAEPLADRVAALNPRVVQILRAGRPLARAAPLRNKAARADQDRLRHQPHARCPVRHLLAGAGADRRAATRAGSRSISGAAVRRWPPRCRTSISTA